MTNNRIRWARRAAALAGILAPLAAWATSAPTTSSAPPGSARDVPASTDAPAAHDGPAGTTRGTGELHRNVYTPGGVAPALAADRGEAEHPPDAFGQDVQASASTVRPGGAARPRASAARSGPTLASASSTAAVNQAFAQGLANGCQYSAALRGTLTTQRAAPVRAGSDEGTAPRYATDLRLDTEISCPGVAHPTARSVRVREAGAAREALLSTLSARGALERTEGAQRCAYVPVFTLERGDLAPGSVRAQCSYGAARGGGPASPSPAVQGNFTPNDDHHPMSEPAPGGSDYDRFPQIRPR